MFTRFQIISLAASFAALGIFASPSLAQGGFMPQERAQDGVSYVSGGIGSDEAEQMRQQAANYPLTLEMATAAGGPRDAYISDARVEIRDSKGSPVLNTTTQGPIMLLRLPSGTYTVDVDWHGTQKHKTIVVNSDRRQHVLLEFADDSSNH